jgi:hypothetical protein
MAKDNRQIQIRILLILIALFISYAAAYGLFSDKFELWNSKAIDQLFVLRNSLTRPPQTRISLYMWMPIFI